MPEKEDLVEQDENKTRGFAGKMRLKTSDKALANEPNKLQ